MIKNKLLKKMLNIKGSKKVLEKTLNLQFQVIDELLDEKKELKEKLKQREKFIEKNLEHCKNLENNMNMLESTLQSIKTLYEAGETELIKNMLDKIKD